MHRGVTLLLLLGIGCSGGSTPVEDQSVPLPRQHRELVVWTEHPVDEELAIRLAAIGTDRVVVRRGLIDLRSGSPVLRMSAAPSVAGDLEIGYWFFVTTGGRNMDEETGALVWHSIASSLDRLPSEVLVEFSEVTRGADGFIRRLAEQSGLPVSLILPGPQLGDPVMRAATQAADLVVVPVSGTSDADLRGLGQERSEPLDERLAMLGQDGVAVRAAIGLRATTKPPLAEWGADLNRLTEAGLGEISTVTDLDRKFTVTRPMDWSGLKLEIGDVVEARWMDLARVNDALQEIDRLAVPEVRGWDLIPLPPPGDDLLGVGREALFSYFEGRGPAPELEVDVRRSGTTLRVTLTNRGPFASAVSAFGNQVEIRIGSGQLVTTDQGDFDRVAFGTVTGGAWASAVAGDVNAVRFMEHYVGPGESIVTGAVRLPSWRTPYTVQWRVVLSTGEEIVSEVIPRQ